MRVVILNICCPSVEVVVKRIFFCSCENNEIILKHLLSRSRIYTRYQTQSVAPATAAAQSWSTPRHTKPWTGSWTSQPPRKPPTRCGTARPSSKRGPASSPLPWATPAPSGAWAASTKITTSTPSGRTTCAYVCAFHRKVCMRAVYARTRRHSLFLHLRTRVDSEY